MGNRNTLQLHKLGCLFLILLISSCGAVKKKTTYSKTPKKRTVSVAPSTETSRTRAPRKRKEKPTSLSPADNIINTALTFSGTRYKYGGTTKKGMDCSGLLYVAFGEHDVQLPRVSYNMAEKGKRYVSLKLKKETYSSLKPKGELEK